MKKLIVILALFILMAGEVAAQSSATDSIVFSQTEVHPRRVFRGRNVTSNLKYYRLPKDKTIYSVIRSGDSIFAVGKFPQIFNRDVMHVDNVKDIINKYWFEKIDINCYNSLVTVTHRDFSTNFCDTIVYRGAMPDMDDLNIVGMSLDTNTLFVLPPSHILFGYNADGSYVEQQSYLITTTADELLTFLNLTGIKPYSPRDIHIFIIHPDEALDYPEIDAATEPYGSFRLINTMEFILKDNRLTKVLFPPAFLQ